MTQGVVAGRLRGHLLDHVTGGARAGGQADLGRRLRIDRKDRHAVVADLERAGLISRVRDAAGAQEAFLAPLDPAEREQRSALLARLIDHHRG